MALTYFNGDGSAAPVVALVPGWARMVTGIIQGDASYPTGGYTPAAASLGFSTKIASIILGQPTTGHVWVPVISGGVWKLKVFNNAGAELADTTAVNGDFVSVWALGW